MEEMHQMSLANFTKKLMAHLNILQQCKKYSKKLAISIDNVYYSKIIITFYKGQQMEMGV